MKNHNHFRRNTAFLFLLSSSFLGATFCSYRIAATEQEEARTARIFTIEGEGDPDKTEIHLGVPEEDIMSELSYEDEILENLGWLEDDVFLIDGSESWDMLSMDPEKDASAEFLFDPTEMWSLDDWEDEGSYQSNFIETDEYLFRIHGSGDQETAMRYFVEVTLDEPLPGGVYLGLRNKELDDRLWLMKQMEDGTYQSGMIYDIPAGEEFSHPFTLRFDAVRSSLERDVKIHVGINVHAIQVD